MSDKCECGAPLEDAGAPIGSYCSKGNDCTFLKETLREIARQDAFAKQTVELSQDYHNFSHRGTPKELRDKLNIGDVYVNGASCKKCGWFIRSRNKHDFLSCKCGATSVDGGSWYCKRVGKPEDYENVIEYFEDVENEI